MQTKNEKFNDISYYFKLWIYGVTFFSIFIILLLMVHYYSYNKLGCKPFTNNIDYKCYNKLIPPPLVNFD